MTPTFLHTAIATLALCFSASALSAPETLDLADAKDRAAALLAEGRRDEARPLLEQVVELDPKDHVSLYNLACVRLSAGDREGAEEALQRAIGVGFVDFGQLLRDPDLAGLRDSKTVRLIERDWARILDVRGDADAKAALDALGPGYTRTVDRDLRLHIVSAFNEDATEAAHEEMRKVARFVDAEMFDIDAPEGRPFPWTLVILPTREHFRKFVPFDGVGGMYDHDQRRLITRDLGPSLRHEFVHVLHHRRMMRLGQAHAFWLQEGLASLVERLEPASGGAFASAPNWRINIARRLAEPRRLLPWDRLFTLDSTTFVTVRPLAMYAQAYAAALWLYERGELRAWLAAYESDLDEAAGGVRTFERVLGGDASALQREWRDWLASKPFVPERFENGSPSLGVDLEESDAEGPRVVSAFGPRGDPKSSLRLRDVLLTVDRTPVKTVAEVIQALEGRKPGDRVEVEVRRGRLELAFTVTVTAFDERASRGLADRLR